MAADSLQLLAKFGHLFCFCVLFFSFYNKYCVYGARELEKKSFMTPSPSSASTKGLQDQSRVRSLNSIPSNDASPDLPGLGPKLPLEKSQLANGNFVVKVGFGTPKRDLTLMFDTGSYLTWIQCLPCPHCYEQEEPIFDPSTSSTFSNATCITPTCSYAANYHDKSFSRGYYARDTLTFSSSDVFPDFVFGCGQDNSPKFGRVAGVLGIGQGDTSVMTQAVENFGQFFCYCLPSGTSTGSGYLAFGMEALQTCQPDFYTPLVLADTDGFKRYFVKLVGITIGNNRLNVSSSSLSNTIIDSGTIVSRLPPSVYSQLRTSFQGLMSKYNPVQSSEPKLFDTCYELQGLDAGNIVPSMTLHFDDSTDLNLDPSAVVVTESDSKVCLAFAANDGQDDLTIIGNHQQRNLNILYDVLGNKVGFNMKGCGN